MNAESREVTDSNQHMRADRYRAYTDKLLNGKGIQGVDLDLGTNPGRLLGLGTHFTTS